jgi:23S rRNA pseudouridine955/2504/2580 synthase
MGKHQQQDFSRVSAITVEEDYAGQRLDNYLLALLKGVPKSRVYRIIRKGEVRINSKRVQAQYKLRVGDVIRVPPIRVAQAPDGEISVSGGLQQSLLQAILYEDSALLVIDKPSGLAVHGGSGLDLGLIEALRVARNDPGLELMHRLDRETSGCLLITKKRGALRQLHADLRDGKIDKIYTALAVGKWPARFSDIRAPLLKNQLSSGERMVVVSKEGKNCHTRFRVCERLNGATLLEAMPITGRTHQIRVHARFAGCPLAGDSKYGEDTDNKAFRALGLRRLFLHASRLCFTTPATGARVQVKAELPSDLRDLLGHLAQPRGRAEPSGV